MYYLSKIDADNKLSACKASVFLWRGVTKSSQIAACKTKVLPSAFEIRLDNNGIPKEPTASLYQNKTEKNDYCKDCVGFFSALDLLGTGIEIKVGRGAALLDLREIAQSGEIFHSGVSFYPSFPIVEPERIRAMGLFHWEIDYRCIDDNMVSHIQTLLSHITCFKLKKSNYVLT